MPSKINRFITIALLLVVTGMFAYRFFNPVTPAPNTPMEVELSPSPAPSVYYFTATTSAQPALELIESQVLLQTKAYDFGLMIEGVNGLLADEKHYWAIYQNGDYAKTGVDQIKLEKDEVIELRYEEIIL